MVNWGGGGSTGEVKEDEYVYMKIVSPFDNEHELFWQEFGQIFPMDTILNTEIDPDSNTYTLIHLTAIYKCIKSIAGIAYVQESGDGSAGLGGKLSPWDLSTTINKNWNGYNDKKIRAIQFYKNTDNLAYSYALSAQNPNYNPFCINSDYIFKRATEYFKNKIIENFKEKQPEIINFFSEYETINIFICFTAYCVAHFIIPDLTNKDIKDGIDSILEALDDMECPIWNIFLILQKNTFVEITKEEYDNICIDVMKSQRTGGTYGSTIYEAYIEDENIINEMFK